MTTLKIYVGTYHKYNCGNLRGRWLDLPMNENELDEALNWIAEGEESPEFMIQDYESDYLKVDECENIHELNEQAQKVADLYNGDLMKLKAYIERGYNLAEALEKVESGDGYFIEAQTKEDLAYSYIDEVYGYVSNLDKETLARYFDFEAFGRDLAFDATQTDDGFLFD